MHILQAATPDASNVAEKFSADSLANKGAQLIETLQTTPPKEILSDLTTSAIQFGLKVVAALAIYFIGAWLIRKIKNIVNRAFTKRGADAALVSFVQSLLSAALWVILIISMVGTLGINTTSLAALLAAGGMAIGMALSGTVQNFAGGLMLLIFKPFKVGDFIEAQGYSGTVMELTIVSTKLKSIDNRLIILPNGALSNGNITNITAHPLRRVDLKLGLSYGTDAAKAKEALLEIVTSNPLFLNAENKGAQDPFVAVQLLDSSSVNFIVRAWVKATDYWEAYFWLNETVYTQLPEKYGINFPYPQLDVHIKDR